MIPNPARVLRNVFLIFVPLLLMSRPSRADLQVELVPRFEAWQNERAVMQEFYGRMAIDATKTVGTASYRARAEGFATYDFAEEQLRPIGNPDLRKSRNEADLSELWFDASFESIGIRVGRQPIRWSQSWTLPSLDLLTGRRANRLFFDPLVDQLTHPDAVRLTKTFSVGSNSVAIEVVRVYGSAPNHFAQPLKNQDRVDNHETAAKVSTRFGSLELGIVGSYRYEPRVQQDDAISGIFGSYAFEDFVFKFEGGNSSRDAGFATAGTDWFLGNWLFGPQFTFYSDPFLGTSESEILVYVPLRYSGDRWIFELDVMQAFQSPIGTGNADAIKNRFASVRIGRELREGLTLSVAAQDYRGNSLSLLGQAESLAGGQVYGLRLEYTGGFTR
ncbi:hypothetical protein BH10BDE1_BH10BDE1_04070 [soil metagenome]